MMEFTTLAFMDAKDILSFLNSSKMRKKYLSHIKRFEHKLRGYDSNGKPLDFTKQDKKDIIKAVQQFAKDIKK